MATGSILFQFLNNTLWYNRIRKGAEPVLIVFEASHSVCTAEPYERTPVGIIVALNEYRWVIG